MLSVDISSIREKEVFIVGGVAHVEYGVHHPSQGLPLPSPALFPLLPAVPAGSCPDPSPSRL